MRESDLADLVQLRADPLTARYQSWSSFDESKALALIERALATDVDVRGKWAQAPSPGLPTTA